METILRQPVWRFIYLGIYLLLETMSNNIKRKSRWRHIILQYNEKFITLSFALNTYQVSSTDLNVRICMLFDLMFVSALKGVYFFLIII